MSELSEAMSVLPVEQRTIVRHSADKLREEFRGTFGVETIELYLIPPSCRYRRPDSKTSSPCSLRVSRGNGSARWHGWRGK